MAIRFGPQSIPVFDVLNLSVLASNPQYKYG